MQDIAWNGVKIGEPGIYSQVPLPRYHDDLCVGPSISSSGLRKIFNESPAHYFQTSYLNPKRTDEDDKEAFILGRATHLLILGDQFFSKLFIQQPSEIGGKAWHGNRTDCKAWKDFQKKAGKTVLTSEQMERIEGMALALGRHPLVMQGVLNGKVERSLVWQDRETGIWLKSRPDVIPTDSADFVDLKITRSVQYESLVQTIGSYGYGQQSALVGEGCRQVMGIEMASFSFVFVEHTPPHCVRIVQLKENDLERGTKQNHRSLRVFAHCLKNNDWPGPGADHIEYIELSERQQKRIDAELERA